MKSFSNEIKVGLTLVVASVLLFTGFRFMRDLPVLHPDQTFYIQFPQVTGLATGRSVFWNGVDVGKVQKITLTKSDSVLVQLTVKSRYEIPTGSTAVLKALDMLGTMAIEIIRGPGPEMLDDYATIPGVVESDAFGSLLDSGVGLTGELGTTIFKLNNILGEMDTVMNTTGGKDLQKLLASAGSMSQTLNETILKKKSEIEKTISQLEQITNNTAALTKDNKAKVDKIVGNLEKASGEMDSITKNLTTLSAELNGILKKINSGQGSIGKMVNDPSLYNNLDSTVVSLNALLKDVKENPKKYTKGLVGL